MGLRVRDECDCDGDHSSRRQAGLTDAEEQIHRSLPEPLVLVLLEPGGIVEQEPNAQQKPACEAKKETDKEAEEHDEGEMSVERAKTTLEIRSCVLCAIRQGFPDVSKQVGRAC